MADNYQINVEIVNKASATLSEISRQLGSIEANTKQFATTATKSFNDVNKSIDTMNGALATIGVGITLKSTYDLIDTIQSLDNKIRLVTGSTDEMNSVYKQLFNVSQETRQGLSGTIDLYSKLALTADQVGVKHSDLSTIVEAYNKTLVKSGSSTQGAAAATYQFAQAMGSGRLQGEELRSQLEQNSAFMITLSRTTGLTYQELRSLAKDGFLTSSLVAQALKDDLGRLNEEMAKMPVTVGQATTQLKNAFQSTVRDFLDASDAGGTLVKTINFVTQNIEAFTIALGVLGTAIVGAMAIRTLIFVYEAYTVAAVAAATATKGVATAFTFLSSTPLGRVISLLGVAAGALYALSGDTDKAQKSTEELSKTTKDLGDKTKTTSGISQEMQDILEQTGITAGKNVTTFSKYLDSLDDQIKYSKLFTNERKNMIEVEKELDKLVESARKKGKVYTEQELEELRQKAYAKQDERDRTLEITTQLEQRYKDYLSFTKSHRDKSLTDIQQFEQSAAAATQDRINISKFTEEQYLAYMDALRADYSKKYVTLIQQQKLTEMTDNQKYQAELQALEDDVRNNRLSKDVSFEDARQAIQRKYAKDYISMAEQNRTQDMTAAEKYHAALTKFQQDAAAQAVLTEEQKTIVLRKLNKDYVDGTVSEYGNLYSYLNNKLLELTGISREKWGIMTDVIKLFGIDTNQILKEVFASGVGIIKNFVTTGSFDVASLAVTTGNSMDWMSNLIAKSFSGLGSIWDTVFGGMYSFLVDSILPALASVALSAWDVVTSIASIAFGGGGGGGGWLGDVISWGADLLGFAEGGIVAPSMGPVMVGESGPELFMPQTSGRIFSNQDTTSMGGSPVNVNFTINAVDATGIEQILLNNRATITNIVRGAVADRGIRL